MVPCLLLKRGPLALTFSILVDVHKWVDRNKLLDRLTVSESTEIPLSEKCLTLTRFVR